jgi:predicted RNase H-like nuclease
MQTGFQLFRRLEAMGYERYPAAADKQVLEVYPHAAFTVMIEQAPLPKASLEGRLQRQLILYDRKLHLPDPMDFFEEITRHRLLRGILPTTELYSPEELDALLAAYVAWLVIHQPQEITCIGDPREGQIVLPCAALKPQY